MGLRINQNIAAQNAYRNLSVSDGQMSKQLEKLSSGFRINRAADDAAGLSISEGLRSQVGGLKVATRNAQDAISVVQTAEGALSEVTSMVQRMRDLAVQSNSAAMDPAAKAASQAEVTELASEITRISQTTTFGTTKLLDGTFNGDFQVGANTSTDDVLNVTIGAMDSATLGIDALQLDTAANSTAAIDALDTALTTITTQRANLGASQNRFEHTINNLNTTVENLSASESRIRDADMATEMVSFTRSQILTQAGTAMLSQANQSSQGVLSLLR
ncbi:flagellin [Actinoplanes lobatus]|jgi:flagellin|uniref:Flagellin n=2 Tax=Actinoplanes lobatus TaxID=113568 RepID=A0A7W7HBE0_9ACTN|nr:flagellin [Actinoplanes lobatus]MBB4747338.1 flagellin [Actinoplanes lobatus]GGN79276.1 flagellin [Actinoplanes lobatus]GIE42691.1 flagellin [Actinoplanes lobatus]